MKKNFTTIKLLVSRSYRCTLLILLSIIQFSIHAQDNMTDDVTWESASYNVNSDLELNSKIHKQIKQVKMSENQKESKVFFNKQLDWLAKGDVNGLVEAQYADNAVMIVNSNEEPVIAEGKEAIKGLFSYYLENFYRGFVSVEKYVETEDSVFFEATINTVAGELRVYDVFILENGKAVRHFSGVK